MSSTKAYTIKKRKLEDLITSSEDDSFLFSLDSNLSQVIEDSIYTPEAKQQEYSQKRNEKKKQSRIILKTSNKTAKREETNKIYCPVHKSWVNSFFSKTVTTDNKDIWEHTLQIKLKIGDKICSSHFANNQTLENPLAIETKIPGDNACSLYKELKKLKKKENILQNSLEETKKKQMYFMENYIHTVKLLTEETEKKEEWKLQYKTKDREYTLLKKTNFFCFEKFTDEFYKLYTLVKTKKEFEVLLKHAKEDTKVLETKKYMLTLQDRLLLTMTKIKCGWSYEVLGNHYGCEASTASIYFKETINFLQNSLQNEVKWLNGNELQANTPTQFANLFPGSFHIIDGCEFHIQKSKNFEIQQFTYSEYKHKNTLKVLVGSCPNGLIEWISYVVGSKTSESWLFSVSMKEEWNKLDANSKLMGDKGFFCCVFLIPNLQMSVKVLILIQKGFCNVKKPDNFEVVVPTKKKGQFSKEEKENNFKISKNRVVIENALGRIKKFKFFQNVINLNEIPMFRSILFVTCGILNIFSPNLRSMDGTKSKRKNPIAIQPSNQLDFSNFLIQENNTQLEAKKKKKIEKFVTEIKNCKELPIITKKLIEELTSSSFSRILQFFKSNATHDFIFEPDLMILSAKVSASMKQKQYHVSIQFEQKNLNYQIEAKKSDVKDIENYLTEKKIYFKKFEEESVWYQLETNQKEISQIAKAFEISCEENSNFCWAFCLKKKGYLVDDYIQCSKCLKWYHAKCVGASQFCNSDLEWICFCCEADFKEDIVLDHKTILCAGENLSKVQELKYVYFQLPEKVDKLIPIQGTCSCKNGATPCAHLGAVLYEVLNAQKEIPILNRDSKKTTKIKGSLKKAAKNHQQKYGEIPEDVNRKTITGDEIILTEEEKKENKKLNKFSFLKKYLILDISKEKLSVKDLKEQLRLHKFLFASTFKIPGKKKEIQILLESLIKKNILG